MVVGTLGQVVNESDYTKQSKDYITSIGTHGKKNATMGDRAANLTGDAFYGIGQIAGGLINVPHIVVGALSNIPIAGKAAEGFNSTIKDYYDMGNSPFKKAKEVRDWAKSKMR